MMLLACLAGVAFAEEPTIVTDRPDIAESSLVVDRGMYQIEQGVLVETVGEDTSVAFPSLHRLGIGHNLELRVETPIMTAGAGGPAFDGVALGFKWHLQDGGDLGDVPSVGVLVHADIAPDGLVSPIGKVAIDTSLPLGLELGINVGGTLTESREPELNYAVACGRFVSDNLRFYAEGSGAASVEDREFGVDGGLSYLITNDVQWDISARQSLVGDAGWYIGTGISARFRKAKAEEAPAS
jgi:hypothetical protein